LHGGAVFILAFFGVELFLDLLVRHLVADDFLGVGIEQPIDHFVDAHLFLLHALGQREDFGDGGGAGGDRLDHVAQPIFDALGDLDLAFAREQLDRAHLAHVHAHRIGGPAEFGVERGNRGFGFLRSVLIGHVRRSVGHEQRFGIRCLVVHLDTHIVDHADDVLDLLGIENVREVVVDLRVRQETTLLAQHDEVFQARTSRLCIVGQSVELLLLDFLDLWFFCHSHHSLAENRGKNRELYPELHAFSLF
jgi:hypothetical protein